jgi:hypothetical protein
VITQTQPESLKLTCVTVRRLRPEEANPRNLPACCAPQVATRPPRRQAAWRTRAASGQTWDLLPRRRSPAAALQDSRKRSLQAAVCRMFQLPAEGSAGPWGRPELF